jgi:hypothetical protein
MALKKKIRIEGKQFFHTDFGQIPMEKNSIDVNAYCKVETVSCNKTHASSTVSFSDGKVIFNKTYDFELVLEGDNFIKQAYVHLKKLSEFADAEDC